MKQLHLFRNKSPVAEFANGIPTTKSISTTTNNSNLNFMQINFTKLQRIPWKACMVLWMLFSLGNVKAQVNAYVFAASSGTYTPLVGGTTVPGFTVGSWDDANATVTLPFTFTYNGVARTQIRVCTNGWASFSTTAVSTYTPISTTTASINNVISPFGRDLQANAGTGNIELGNASTRNITLFKPLTPNHTYPVSSPSQIGWTQSIETGFTLTLLTDRCSQSVPPVGIKRPKVYGE
jgi:hypothetical protein